MVIRAPNLPGGSGSRGTTRGGIEHRREPELCRRRRHFNRFACAREWFRIADAIEVRQRLPVALFESPEKGPRRS